MANIASAKKRVRKAERQHTVNRARLSRMHTFTRAVEEAIASGDKEAAETALRAVEPELARSAQRGIIHRNTVARKLSRLSVRVRSL